MWVIDKYFSEFVILNLINYLKLYNVILQKWRGFLNRVRVLVLMHLYILI
jgi:hypothetical protein